MASSAIVPSSFIASKATFALKVGGYLLCIFSISWTLFFSVYSILTHCPNFGVPYTITGFYPPEAKRKKTKCLVSGKIHHPGLFLVYLNANFFPTLQFDVGSRNSTINLGSAYLFLPISSESALLALPYLGSHPLLDQNFHLREPRLHNNRKLLSLAASFVSLDSFCYV